MTLYRSPTLLPELGCPWTLKLHPPPPFFFSLLYNFLLLFPSNISSHLPAVDVSSFTFLSRSYSDVDYIIHIDLILRPEQCFVCWHGLAWFTAASFHHRSFDLLTCTLVDIPLGYLVSSAVTSLLPKSSLIISISLFMYLYPLIFQKMFLLKVKKNKSHFFLNSILSQSLNRNLTH